MVKQVTYAGDDVNADGKVDADDHFAIDSGFLEQPPDPPYEQGDINFEKATPSARRLQDHVLTEL